MIADCSNISIKNMINSFGGYTREKQPPEVFCKKKRSYKFHKTRRKTPVQSLFFNKVADTLKIRHIKSLALCSLFFLYKERFIIFVDTKSIYLMLNRLIIL